MKRSTTLFTIFLLGLFTLSTFVNEAFSQEEKAEGPLFEYKAENNRLELDTMYISSVEEVNLDIEFENKGNAPLLLSNVRACCGTRVVDYPGDPVNPGDIGIIKISFRLVPRPHNISRSVIVSSNDPGGQKVLRITGRVEQGEE